MLDRVLSCNISLLVSFQCANGYLDNPTMGCFKFLKALPDASIMWFPFVQEVQFFLCFLIPRCLQCQVNPQFYAFRWITLLLTQEFNFADSLQIWDTLLSDPDGPQVGTFLVEKICLRHLMELCEIMSS